MTRYFKIEGVTNTNYNLNYPVGGFTLCTLDEESTVGFCNLRDKNFFKIPMGRVNDEGTYLVFTRHSTKYRIEEELTESQFKTLLERHYVLKELER